MELVLFKPGRSYSSGINLNVRLNDTSSPVVDYIELVSLRFGAQTASTLVDGNRTSAQPEVSSIALCLCIHSVVLLMSNGNRALFT